MNSKCICLTDHAFVHHSATQYSASAQAVQPSNRTLGRHRLPRPTIARDSTWPPTKHFLSGSG